MEREQQEPHEVRILADDLTGALDAAAPFAAADRPLPVRWPPHRPSGTRHAYDSESRDGGNIRHLIGPLVGDGVAFKKIDSLFRGSTFAEIRACVASKRFRSVVLAPAFPAQQRITRSARQLWRTGPADAWEVAADLREVLPEDMCHIGIDDAVTEGGGVFVCDAEVEEDLERLAASRFEPPTLWIGTAGLARALAGAGLPPAPPQAPLLIIVGSHHAVTLDQVDALARHKPEAIVRLQPGSIVTPAVEAAASRVENAGFATFVFAFPDGTGADVAGPMFDAAFLLLKEALNAPRTLLVTGGSTLFRLVNAFEAHSLDVEGEWRPGIPISTLTGSRWHGTRVISKSGGFGDPRTLVELAQDLGGLRG